MESFILCIDDDKENLEILRVLLINVMNISQAEFWGDSQNFLERMLTLPSKPELILMDIQIRPLDGHEMLDQLRQHENLKDIKVIAHTASVMEDQVNQMKQDGFDGLIGKPIVRQLFPDILYRLLAGESIWYIT